MSFVRNLLPFFPTADSVAVYDQDFNQLFPQARMLKANVKEDSKQMEHPVETGATITDHRIILPTEIELSIIIPSRDYPDVYKAIKSYWLNATLLVVQTRTDVYPNQFIGSLPHEEDPALYNTITIALKLKQILFVTAQYNVVPKSQKNSTTVNRGTQQPAPVPKQSSLAIATDMILGKS